MRGWMEERGKGGKDIREMEMGERVAERRRTWRRNRKKQREAGGGLGREGETWGRGKNTWRPNKGKVGEKRAERFGFFPQGLEAWLPSPPTGHPQKTGQGGAQSIFLGWPGGLQWGRGAMGLLCFRIGIKQHYFGFHAEFLTSGGGSEAQAQARIPSFVQWASWGQVEPRAKMSPSPRQLRLPVPLPAAHAQLSPFRPLLRCHPLRAIPEQFV